MFGRPGGSHTCASGREYRTDNAGEVMVAVDDIQEMARLGWRDHR
jgi:hypothetical protein